MPVLPLIDLMLLAGWTSLMIGFILKAVYLVTAYRPTVLSLTPIDFLMIAIAAMLFAIALAARSWVASQAPATTAARRRDETMEAYRRLHAAPENSGADAGGYEAGSAAVGEAAQPRR